MKIYFSIKKALFVCSTLFAGALSASAANYYFNMAQFIADTTASQKVNLSNTITDTSSYWFTSADFSESSKVTDKSFSFLNDSANDITFGDSSTNFAIENRSLVLDKTIDVKSFKSCKLTGVWNAVYPFFQGSDAASVIKIGSYDFVGTNSSALQFFGANTNIKIGNISTHGYFFGKDDAPIAHAEINKITLLQGNNGKSTFFYFNGTGSSVDNPDFKVGSITATENEWVTKEQLLLLFGNTNKITNKVTLNNSNFVWIDKLTGDAGLGVGISTAASTGNVTYVLTSSDVSVSKNGLYQYSAENTQGTAGVKMNIVMRSQIDNGNGTFSYSAGSQTFLAANTVISGNVTIESGSLFINYTGLGKDMAKGALILSKAAGATVATFGNSNTSLIGETQTYVGGSYTFSSLEVAGDGGTIRVRLDYDANSNLVYDALSLTGSATGTGVVVIDLKNSNGNLPDEMIDFMIDQNLTLKVISWSALADSGIEFTTTDAYKTYNFNGQDYVFNAVNAADGLYINYIQAVPEPSTFAALFALLTLSFIIWRKRS